MSGATTSVSAVRLGAPVCSPRVTPPSAASSVKAAGALRRRSPYAPGAGPDRVRGDACTDSCRTGHWRCRTCFDRAEQLFPKKEIVTATATGRDRTHLRRVGRAHPAPRRRARRRSASPRAAGWRRSRGTRPAISSCTSRAPCSGRVLHTLNIRLFPEQLTYIVNHAEDEVIFVDRSLLGAALAAASPRSRPCATSS